MKKEIRASLSDGETSRLQEFKVMMSGISKDIENLKSQIKNLKNQAQSLVKEFHGEHVQRKAEIRASLSDGETSRLQEFKVMMSGINKDIENLSSQIQNLKKQAQSLVKEFHEEHLQRKNEIRASLSDGETSRLQEFKVMMSGISKDIENLSSQIQNLKKQAQSLVKEFHGEHVQRKAEIRASLSDGETSRLQEFNIMMSDINKDITDMKNTIQEMLKNFQKERIAKATDLEKVIGFMTSEKNATQEKKLVDEQKELLEPEKEPVPPQEPVLLTTPKEVKSTPKEVKPTPKEVKPTPKEVKPTPREVKSTPEEVKSTPKEVKSTPKEVKSTPKEVKSTPKEVKSTPKEVKSTLTLQKEMLAFLADHPNGALIGELEKLLGTPRLKLGRIAKELLEQGKLRKEGNWFFPLSQKPSNQG